MVTFNLHTTFGKREKTAEFYCDFCWDFKAPSKSLNLQQEKNIILEDFLNNYTLIEAILNQFKAEFLPIIQQQNLCQINLSQISAISQYENAIAHQNIRVSDPETLVNANVIKQADLQLPQIKFTKLEQIVMELYLRGATADEIGQQIHRSRKTIESYIAKIKEKFGCHKRSEVYAQAEKLSLLQSIAH